MPETSVRHDALQRLLSLAPMGTRGATLATAAAELLRGRFDTLVGVVLFGSYARGDHGPDSDLDVLAVLRETRLRPTQRADVASTALAELRRTDAWKQAVEAGLLPELSPLVLTTPECRRIPPILMDVATEGVVIWDGGGVASLLSEIRQRMAHAGVKRVELPDGRRYWDLRPGMRLGEVVEF